MKILAVHDALGRIVSITRVAHGLAQGVGILPDAGNSVLVVEVPDLAENTPLIDIHNNYYVDLERKTVIKRPQ